MDIRGIRIRRQADDIDWGFDEIATTPYFVQGDEVGILAMHGFMGTPANMRLIADAAAKNGHTVYAPLLSGHGTTLSDMKAQSAEVWLADAEAAYAKLIDAGCKKIFLMGLSMGGVLMSLLAQRHKVDGLVLLSTPFRLQDYLIHAGKAGRFAPYVIFEETAEEHLESLKFRPYNQTYNGAATARLRDVERLTIRARGHLDKIECPLLVMQSVHDDKVDLTSVFIAKYGIKSRDMHLVWLEDSPHGCTYGPEREKVAAACAEFVERTLAKGEKTTESTPSPH